MKRFLQKKIVIAQNFDSGGIEVPIFKPSTPEGQSAKELSGLTNEQRTKVINDAFNNLVQNVTNTNAAISIYTAHGLDEEKYKDDVENAFKNFYIPPVQYNQYIIGLWPKMQSKNFTFNAFLELFDRVADRFKNSNRIDQFFESFSSVLPDLSKTVGLNDAIINQAVDFLLQGKNAEDFQQYLLYEMISKYALFGEIPENKQADITKATEKLEEIKRNVNSDEQEVFNYLWVKANFIKEHEEFYKQVTFALMDIRKDNFLNLIGLMREGIDEKSIKFYFKNLKYGDFYNLFRSTQPYSPNQDPEYNVGRKTGASSKFKKVLAADEREDTAEAANTTSSPASAPPPSNTSVPTPEFTIYGKFTAQINQFEATIQTLVRQTDADIAYVLNKQSSSPQIGPFSSGNVFQYLQDDDESLAESDEIVQSIDEFISYALDLKNDLIVEVNKTNILPFEYKKKELVLKALDEKFELFKKDMRAKQLGLKFNKVLISRQNEYSEAEDLYNNLKIDMENNVSARPVIAPKAVLAGFRMADILEEIAEEFKVIAGNNPLRQEQAMKTARRWENFAKQQRATVFTEIYPAMAQSIGIEATKPSISPSFSLRGAYVDIVKNLRTAGKFMNKEVESDKRFRDYWNNLFMQSKDPRPMGDIIEEKPKHGNLTTDEDAKLHKKTMRKFKKPVSKKPRFKKDNN